MNNGYGGKAGEEPLSWCSVLLASWMKKKKKGMGDRHMPGM